MSELLSKVKYDYSSLKAETSQPQWQKIGTKRRSGVATPLFSIYSKSSIGIGEIPDLKLLVDWCAKTGMSIIQLLPMNDTGFNFRPYDAQSSFAIDPMYVSIENLKKVSLDSFREEIKHLQKKFPTKHNRVDYKIKKAKLELLWLIFKQVEDKKNSLFESFQSKNKFWLNDYARFKVIQEISGGKNWESWEYSLKQKDFEATKKFENAHRDKILFQMWLQWQLFEQFKEVKSYASKKGVLLMGDLPFLVSRDSADVWSFQNYFNLNLAAGAPPDAFIANGQRWGMPPYRWDKIAEDSYEYLVQKLKCAENFYDLFRIDHVVGIFRLWSIPLSEPYENGGLNGFFDPKDESYWEAHGRKILKTITERSQMLACAEDLGVVPDCSYKVLDQLSIPGMDVARWKKNWHTDLSYVEPEHYRKNSIAVFSTHDMTSLAGWWEHEVGAVDEIDFTRRCTTRSIPFEEIKRKLFDLEDSKHGKLTWNSALSGIEEYKQILGRPEHEIQDFLHLFKESFNEKKRFWIFLGLSGEPSVRMNPELAKAVLKKVSLSASIFSIQLLQDWLSIADSFSEDSWSFRINMPGTVSDANWNIRMPYSLEELIKLPINQLIHQIHVETGRVAAKHES